MTNFRKLNQVTTKLIACAGALALIAGMSLSTAAPAYAWDCLLDTNNDGNADTDVDTDAGADSGGFSTKLACGDGASAAGDDSTALGSSASAGGGDSTALGHSASAAGLGSTAVGNFANAAANYSTALGGGAYAEGYRSTALGDNAGAEGAESTALGGTAYAPGINSTAVGSSAVAEGINSTALGAFANDGEDAGDYSTTVGAFARSSGVNTIAIGADTADAGFIGAYAQGADSIVIGTEASDGNNAGAIVIGTGASATEAGQVVLKNASTFTILGNGDMGLGTAMPAGNLDVNSGAADTIFLLTNDTAQWEFKSNAGNGKLTFGNKLTGTKPFKFGPDAIGNLLQIGIVATDQVDIKGNLVTTGTITTGGPTCGGGCDAVFGADYDLPSIEEHAAQMFANSYLPQVGPTVPHAPMNISEKVGDMLNELEKAHIYIAQINAEKQVMQAEITRLKTLEMRVLALEHQGRE